MGIPGWLAQGIPSFRQLPLTPTRKFIRHSTGAPNVKHKTVLRVLGQMQGPYFVPIASLSKQLDTTIQGWPACLRVLAAATLLAQESKKLTFGTPTVIRSTHDLKDLLSHKAMALLSPSRIQLIQPS